MSKPPIGKVFSKQMAFLPHLSVDASDTAMRIQIPPRHSLSAFSARVNLFKFGADSAALSAAHKDFSSQSESLEDVKLTSEQEAVEALANLIEKKTKC